MNRRAMLGWSVGAGAAAALARVCLAVASGRRRGEFPMLYDWKPTRVSHVLVAAGESGNMVLVLGAGGAGGAGTILIDTQACPYGPQIRREAEHLGRIGGIGGKVELLISTHHHAEITGGHRAFTSDTRVIGHVRNAERVGAQMNRYISQVKEFLFRKEDPAKEEAWEAVRGDFVELHKHKGAFTREEFVPNETIGAGRRELRVVGRRVVLLAMNGPGKGGAHTDNDVVVHLPDDDVLITGGVVSHVMHPVVDRDSGANTRGWEEALGRLESMCTDQTVVVPGEGAIGTVAAIVAQRQYFSSLRSSVEAGVARGLSRAQVRELKPSMDVGEEKSSRLGMALDTVYAEVHAERAGQVRKQK